MNLLSLGAMPDWVVETLNSLWMMLCKVAYYFVNILYQVFQTVANINLFSEDIFEKLTGRMYVIIGLVMLFVFAYNLILTIINPEDKKSTSGMVNVVKETIISLVIVILLPLIFNYLFIIQEHILSSNIIGTIVFGGVGNSSGTNSTDCDDGDYDCTCNFEDFDFSLFSGQGNVDADAIRQDLTNACNNYKSEPEYKRGANIIAPTILSAFFTPVGNDFEDCVSYLKTKSTSSPTPNLDDDTGKICTNYFYDVTYSKYTGDISSLTDDSVLVDGLIDGKMELHSFMAFGAGLLTLYIMFCYALEIGVRVAKLGFLQLISPIPVMLRVIPGQKEKIYSKWFDNLKNTYLDVFIRVAIIYFALFGVSLVPQIFNTIFNNIGYGDGNGLIKVVSIAIVILGILKFAQDAPKLFKELFSMNGNFAVRSPRKQLEENKLVMGGIGAVGAGIGSASRNAFREYRNVKDNSDMNFVQKAGAVLKTGVGGLAGGMTRGAKAGYSSNMSNLGRNIDQSVDETTAKKTERAKYKSLHGNTVRGAIAGHIGDAVASRVDWMGASAGRDILDTIRYEEDVLRHYDDYESMFKSGGYVAMDNRLKEMKAAQAAGQGYDGIAYDDLGTAINQLETSMRKKREDAIKENTQNAAYIAYEFSQSLFADRDEFEKSKIKANLEHAGVSAADLELLEGLQIKNNKVVDKNGVELNESQVIQLLEGASIGQGINGAGGAIKGQLSADKQSVAYKHQTKLEQERKEKESKK